MPTFERFTMPDAGEGLTEADIVTWHVAVGDPVTVNQTIVEIETAKSLVELPSPFTGVVAEILAVEGTTVEVGQPIIVIDTDPTGAAGPVDAGAGAQDQDQEPAAEASDVPEESGSGAVLVGYGVATAGTTRRARRATEPSTPSVPDAVGQAAAPAPAPARTTTASPAPASPANARSTSAPSATVPSTPAGLTAPASAAVAPSARPASVVPALVHPVQSVTQVAPRPGTLAVRAKPPVRKFARDMGVDLSSVHATGPGGIVTREDVLAYSAQAQPRALATYVDDDAPWLATGQVSSDGRQTRVPVKSVRKRTAEAMVASAFTAPHVTVFHTVDVTKTMRLVARLREDREFTDVRVTPLLITAKALLLAVNRHPEINASWDEVTQEIVYKHYINLGIAASTPRGLVVPNIKDAHRLGLKGLAQGLADLTATARAGRTSPADMSDGTITITNVGVFGIDTGTPILNPGEAAILAFGAIREQPWVHKGKIKKRFVTQLALSVDHRLVDGALGSRLLSDVAAVLEEPSQALVWG
ncbi:pyruvate dehydrogenase E2 component (dihydrolipoamide acetyltransferase) [Sanguibacter gelidistatuariae]|uniref:Dihydrolipoamide acetyltransferase component of pyruvate dehydrogenase complex n=1 Tax=Sanguibacter gelidistatuariae TaxID=1814289 RepID=A0A1G6H9F6_9MICO|nr:dihydrolipoamide acetyltransferase family protein [Sanguibacter gelidistatuariae]SDB90892.1 pyruvate dehydrogenase E2 component (dihydrolipoamide acetyltransferase) [Sanguibacter gelidistatuariae]